MFYKNDNNKVQDYSKIRSSIQAQNKIDMKNLRQPSPPKNEDEDEDTYIYNLLFKSCRDAPHRLRKTSKSTFDPPRE